MKAKSLKARILEDIRKTGFLTELEVARLLLGRGFRVENGRTYEDLDETKSREIDLVANAHVFDKETNLRLFPHLVIEVKKDPEKPWVIFLTDDAFAHYGWSILHAGYHYQTEKAAVADGSAFATDILAGDSTMTGKAFYEAFRGASAPSRIYEALLTASKAAFYQMQKFRGHESPTKYSTGVEVYLELYIPLVVVDGLLFSLSLDTKGDEHLAPSRWIPVRLPYSSPRYREALARDVTFRPYVVQLKFLPDFLDVFATWMDRVRLNISRGIIRQRARDARKPKP